MVVKKFHLVGTDGNSEHLSVDIGVPPDVQHLRLGLASKYGIIQPEGISFEDACSETLHDVEDILDCNASIGITIDGQPIREPSGPKDLPIVGNHYEIYPDHLGNHARLFTRYGRVVKTNNLGRIAYVTDDPETSKFVFGENDFFTKAPSDPNHPLFGLRDNSALFLCDTDSVAFKLAHKFVPPCMTPKAVRHYTPMLNNAVENSFKVFDELDDRRQPWNVHHYMLKMAGQVICQLVLGKDLHHFDEVDSPTNEIITTLAKYLQLNRKVQTRGDWYSHLPFGDPKALYQVREKLYALMERCVQDARRGGDENLPIHTAALDASCLVDYLARATDEKGAKLPHEYILSNAIALTGAGFVTSTSFLSWLIYALVKYPGAQEKLLQELVNTAAATCDSDTSNTTNASSLGTQNARNGRPKKPTEIHWTYDLIHSLPYLDAFVKETQRLHSPSFQPGRNTRRPVILPGGYRLPAKAILTPSIPHLHNNPAHWRDPARFLPERWDTEEVQNRHRTAYVPFATGPRGCVGYNVALQEVKVVLANLVSRYEFVDACQEPVVYDPEFLVIRPLNLYVRAVRRKGWPEPSPRPDGMVDNAKEGDRIGSRRDSGTA